MRHAPPLQPRAGDRPPHGWHGVALALIAAFAAAAGSLVTSLLLFPEPLVLPATVASLLLAAATSAAIAWFAPREAGSARLVFWDIAGAMTVIGLAAALIGEPEPAVALLERNR